MKYKGQKDADISEQTLPTKDCGQDRLTERQRERERDRCDIHHEQSLSCEHAPSVRRLT